MAKKVSFFNFFEAFGGLPLGTCMVRGRYACGTCIGTRLHVLSMRTTSGTHTPYVRYVVCVGPMRTLYARFQLGRT